MKVDRQKIQALLGSGLPETGPDVLRRLGNVFFVGGNLPVYETLETMFESYCMESTGLFHLTFGNNLQGSLEMARLIKKNFSVRLLGKLDYPVPAETLERIYAAGVDILDIPLMADSSASNQEWIFERAAKRAALTAARSVFPRWSVVSSLAAGLESAETTVNTIDGLIHDGIMPLVSISVYMNSQETEEAVTIFNHLASAWKTHHAPVKALLPLIMLTTPLILREQPGRVRDFFDRIRDRQQMASADLQRHLRVGQAQDSLDSAGL